MKYLYRAEFTDRTTFQQPSDDASKLRPGEKSAMFDFLEYAKTRTIAMFHLEGSGCSYSVEHSTGRFFVNGSLVALPGYPLPEGLHWVEGDPYMGVYFRRVTRTFNRDLEQETMRILYCFGVKHESGVKNFLGVY